jgi:threonine/homoserine/homoserine lactone efflux protein
MKGTSTHFILEKGFAKSRVYKIIIKGFRFGMLLQIAIGPVFMYIFRTATDSGIMAAESGVIAATIVDAIFVLMAIYGVGAIIEKDKIKKVLKYIGIIVLVYYGMGLILGANGIDIMLRIGGIDEKSQIGNAFITTIILTSSSPLSIMFWTGIFSTKISCEGYNKREMILYGAGAVLATLVFLGLSAIVFGTIHTKISDGIKEVLNMVVGAVLVGFAIKMTILIGGKKKIVNL